MSAMKNLLRFSLLTVLILLVVSLLLAAGLVSGLQQLLTDWNGPLTVHLGDETFVIGSAGPLEALVAVGVVVVVALFLMLLLPVVMVLVLLALLVGLGLPALALGGVAVLLFSPVLLLAGLLWFLLRRRPVGAGNEQAAAPGGTSGAPGTSRAFGTGSGSGASSPGSAHSIA
jgi:hypothetical protein